MLFFANIAWWEGLLFFLKSFVLARDLRESALWSPISFSGLCLLANKNDMIAP